MAKTSFQVNLDNIELSKSQMASLEKEINSVVAKHIVNIVQRGTPLGIKLKINPEWLGIWLKKFKTVDELKGNLDYKNYKF